MHRYPIDRPAVEIAFELFRRRMCLIEKDGLRQKPVDDIDTVLKESQKQKSLDKEGIIVYCKKWKSWITQENVKYGQKEWKNDSIASSKQNSPSQKT